jgi:hypothetical protein
VKDIAACLQHESIVLQGHAVRALTKIVSSFPDMAPSVFKALLEAKGSFPGNRIGFVVEAMAVFSGHPKLAAKAKQFVASYLQSDVKSVATKARKAHKALQA